MSKLTVVKLLDGFGDKHECYYADDVEAEIERLTHENGVLSADVNFSIENGKNLRAEIARLRAALERIASCECDNLFAGACGDCNPCFAREALQ